MIEKFPHVSGDPKNAEQTKSDEEACNEQKACGRFGLHCCGPLTVTAVL
jgi:hypothetical protein